MLLASGATMTLPRHIGDLENYKIISLHTTKKQKSLIKQRHNSNFFDEFDYAKSYQTRNDFIPKLKPTQGKN